MTSLSKPMMTMLTLTLLLAACGKNTSTADSAEEDTSASSAAAESLGGALSGSSSDGTLAAYRYDMPTSFYARVRSEISPLATAFAQSLCPTFHNTDAQCSTLNGDMWLAYSDCSFAGRATWNGVQRLSMSAGTAACGSFPNPGASQILYRQFAANSGSTSAGALTLTAGGFTGTVDDSASNLGNFDGHSFSAINPNGGYGVAVHFGADGKRSSLSFGHQVTINSLMDHSVYGSGISITETSASERSLSGTVTVYHNKLRVIGTSSFTGLTHSDTCCVPIAGTITTSFTRGTASPTALGALMVGKSETLTFNGCGSATLVDTDGASHDVTLKRCF